MTLWYPKAIRRDGPANKVGYPTSTPTDKYGPKRGVVYHSSEGSKAAWFGVLDSQRRPRRSATFFNPKRGRLYQHYRRDAHCWANGTKAANIGFVSCENEGVAGEPLTASQVDNLVGLTAWLQEQNRWAELSRATTLREHNEFTPTACPSGRIPWAIIIERATKEDTDMLYIFKNPLKPGQWWVGDRISSKRKIMNTAELNALRRDGAKEIAVNEDLFNAMG